MRPDQNVRSGCPPVGDPGRIIRQLVALGLDHAQQRLEGRPVQLDGEMAVGPADRPLRIGQRQPRQVLARLVRQGQGRLVLQHGEAGGDLGFDREAPQQLLAEGVDGLNLQPARRLQRLGEQPPRLRQLGARHGRGVPRLQIGQRAGQVGVVHHRPGPEPVEQPRLHLRRRRLGVGDAQDLAGLDLLQQQPRHPVDQGRGLARAGVGGDEDRLAGIGGGDLVRVGQDARAHSASPPSSPPTTCHSQTRARWS